MQSHFIEWWHLLLVQLGISVMKRCVINVELVTLFLQPHTCWHFTYIQCHSPQEPAVSQPILVPADPRARPQEPRQLPLQHHRGSHHLGGVRGRRNSERVMMFQGTLEATDIGIKEEPVRWGYQRLERWQSFSQALAWARHHATCLTHHPL